MIEEHGEFSEGTVGVEGRVGRGGLEKPIHAVIPVSNANGKLDFSGREAGKDATQWM